MDKPEERARAQIDEALRQAGWELQTAGQENLTAARGVAVREFPLSKGHGYADYLLYVDEKAAGVVEAKKVGMTLTGVEPQAEKYSRGMPASLPTHLRPLPFLYQSTGVETRFTNLLDPEARSRNVFHFHKPETLAEWLAADPLLLPLKEGKPDPRSQLPSTLRSRLRALPELDTRNLWGAQDTAIRNLEKSLYDARPRALIQMATGSGKTFTAISSIYRLIKFGGARRVLFLVDRANLGRQALKEFQQYVPPDDNRKFTELYNVQHLTSNKVDPVARVCITTIQRLYSMLQGQELSEENEEHSLFDSAPPLAREALPAVYNPGLPIEFFDFLFVDECHRSIYNLWRQVLEYFDSFLVGLTATPSKQTLGFFHQNLVMEYGHTLAVAHKVNVDFQVYRIREEITEQGSKVDSGVFVGKRDRLTRHLRWERLEDDFPYDPEALDRKVVAKDQIRTLVRTFRDKLFTEIFPGRTEVPKTLVFAKDDSHADDIVQMVREEFAKGNEFAQKITYRTTGAKPEQLISDFRNSYHPRIAVTVDMIATGTDIKPLEIVMFMRAVKSRNFFEQMKGRGVRVINPTDLRAVTPDATAKTHFVIVDCVGVCEQELQESQPLEREPTVAFKTLLDEVGRGATDPDLVSSLASRLTRLDRRLGKADQAELARLAGGVPLSTLVAGLVEAVDLDRQVEQARREHGLSEDAQPTEAQVAETAKGMIKRALAPLYTNPKLRNAVQELKQRSEQVIDEVSQGRVLEAGFSEVAKEKAKGLVESFEQFLRDHKDEITALQVLYSKPWAKRLRYADVKALADAIQAPPRAWTAEQLWQAYEKLGRGKVKGTAAPKRLADVVSLVRFALGQEAELVPFPERVEARFRSWMAQQENRGRKFTPAQREWLELIKDHVATSIKIEKEDFDDVPFNQKGGLGKVYQLFGKDLDGLLEELNEELVA